MTWLGILIVTVLNAILYRLGGLGQGGWERYKWIPRWLCHSIVRDLGCSLVTGLWMLIYIGKTPLWICGISGALMWIALTTYWDDEFGYDNFYAHGVGVAIAYIMYAIFTKNFLPFGFRILVLSLSMGLWCQFIAPVLVGITGWRKDNIDELGRGACIGLTLSLLLL